MDRLIRNLHVLWRAEMLISSVKLRLALKRGTLLAFAGLAGFFCLAMLNVAGFFVLQAGMGAVVAALLVAAADFLIAVAALFLAQGVKAGPELALAKEVRQAAMEELEAEIAAVQAEIRAFRDQFASMKEATKSFVRHPIDSAVQAMILPLVKSIIKSHRSKTSRSPNTPSSSNSGTTPG
jgi:hypothetical protein